MKTLLLEGRPGIYASERLVDDKCNQCFWQNGGLQQINKSSVLKREREISLINHVEQRTVWEDVETVVVHNSCEKFCYEEEQKIGKEVTAGA